MTTVPLRRKVLIVEDESAVRNVLYLLLANLGCEGDIAWSDEQALAMVGREDFDAVLLDLRWPGHPPGEVVPRINAIQPSLMGRVLVVTGEVVDSETLELIERYCLQRVWGNRIIEGILVRLRALLGMAQSPDTAL